MLPMIEAVLAFQKMSILGRIANGVRWVADIVFSALERDHMERVERERVLNLSKYRTYNETADPFLLVEIGPEDLSDPSQQDLCGRYVLLWSECIELRKWMEEDAYNQAASKTGEALLLIGFDVQAILRGGKARLQDRRVLWHLGKPQHLSTAHHPQQETLGERDKVSTRPPA